MKLFLFTHDPVYAKAAVAAGVDGIVVDWEFLGKKNRQFGFDTEINNGTPETLQTMRALTSGSLLCRINNHPMTRLHETQLACALGADEILLPMVRHPDEVQECLSALLPGHTLSILVETEEALLYADAFATLPLTRVYVGLNDLSIQRRSVHLLDPLIDGTIQRFRSTFTGSFSVAGITLPDKGAPIPSKLLMGELLRLNCDFGIGRRSFRRDIPLQNLPMGVAAIRAAWQELQTRTTEQIQTDHRTFVQCVQSASSMKLELQCA